MDAPGARALAVRRPDMAGPDVEFQPVSDRPQPRLRAVHGGWVATVAQWCGGHLLWSLDQFARWFVSGLVFLGLRWLFGHWWFPRELWDEAPTLARGFDHARDVTPSDTALDPDEADDPAAQDDPRRVFIMALDEGGGRRLTFWDHTHRWDGQRWPCVLLLSHPCRRCEWFVPEFQGRPVCIAAERVRLRTHPRYRYSSLAQLREEIDALTDAADDES